jgi:hypothetical protein
MSNRRWIPGTGLAQDLREPCDPVFDAVGKLYAGERGMGGILKLSGERW